MKYNNDFFKLSREACNTIIDSKKSDDDRIIRKQNKLLLLLLNKFEKSLKNITNNNGILKVRFIQHFWSDLSDGYNEIYELVNSNNFDSFFSDYCIYVGDIDIRYDNHDSYIEIIWDYKNYFEQLKDLHKDEDYCSKNGHEFGDWLEKRWTTLEEAAPTGKQTVWHINKTNVVEHVYWYRKCKNCNLEQTIDKKPLGDEVLDGKSQDLQLKLRNTKK